MVRYLKKGNDLERTRKEVEESKSEKLREPLRREYMKLYRFVLNYQILIIENNDCINY